MKYRRNKRGFNTIVINLVIVALQTQSFSLESGDMNGDMNFVTKALGLAYILYTLISTPAGRVVFLFRKRKSKRYNL